MNRTILKLLAALVLLALIGVLAWYFFLREKPQGDEPIEGDEVSQEGEEPNTETETPAVQTGSVEPSSIARSFVERFGSFSTEADYQNVYDVMPLSTQSLASRLEGIAQEARQSASDEYYGVSTRVVVVETVKESTEAVTLELTTQREESIGGPENTSVRYQDISVYLVKDGRSWLVDDFAWSD